MYILYMVEQNHNEEDDDFEQTVNYTPADVGGAYLRKDEGKYWLMKEADYIGEGEFYVCKICGKQTLINDKYGIVDYKHSDDCHLR